MKALRSTFSEIKRYPSALAGLVIIILLVIAAMVILIALPYNEAVRLWRGGEGVWYKNPKTAPPAWTNFFTAADRPATLT